MNKTPVGSPTSWGWADMPGVPSGLIAMWHGLIANIPSGWLICDGNSGTPNLLAKFVEGVATAATNPGATGGATSKDLDLVYSAPTAVSPTESGYVRGLSGSIKVYIGGSTSPYDQPRVNQKIIDIRPLFYDVAFIMRT